MLWFFVVVAVVSFLRACVRGSVTSHDVKEEKLKTCVTRLTQPSRKTFHQVLLGTNLSRIDRQTAFI